MHVKRKPGITARLRAAKRRKDQKVAERVRDLCVARDGHCRYAWDVGPAQRSRCVGDSQWAHFGDQKRFKTRGMAAEQRHATEGSLMLCARHHFDYDRRALVIEPEFDNSRGCDGPLTYREAE